MLAETYVSSAIKQVAVHICDSMLIECLDTDTGSVVDGKLFLLRLSAHLT